MNKVKDVSSTLWIAISRSMAFCWRNDWKNSLGRIIFTICTALVSYFIIVLVGQITNTIQSTLAENKVVVIDYYLLTSPIGKQFGQLSAVLFAGLVFGVLNSLCYGMWRSRLRPANTRELYLHKAGLDIARVKSKEFDDLAKRINDLPASWHTRFFFTDELFIILSSVASFVLFAGSLATKWWEYALILLISSIPSVLIKFRIVGKWWDLAEELAPTHKHRNMLERPYRDNRDFAQAKSFAQLPHLRMFVDDIWKNIIGRYDNIRKKTSIGEVVVSGVAILGLCIVIGLAAASALSGSIELGTMTVIIASARAFQGNLADIIGRLADQWNSAKGVALIERDYFNLKPLITTPNPVALTFSGPPEIRLEDVSFTYHGSETVVLSNVNAVFEPGSIVGVVGKSGSGKSTLASLLIRQYDPTSGRVLMGDIPYENIEPEHLSDVIACMLQDVVVHERKFGEEIASSRLGDPIDMKAVEDASRFAQFQEIIDSDPKGFESQYGVEFGGRDISGGEKKRLAFARVMYRGSKVLILDEPDAYLDPELAHKVMNNLFSLRGKVTVILITHHVANTQHCDKVIVMHEGTIVETGKPADLLCENGKYASMFAKDKARKAG